MTLALQHKELAKENYLRRQFDLHKNNLKTTWKLIGMLINRKKSQVTIKKLIYDNKCYIDKASIAHQLNNYYLNIGPGAIIGDGDRKSWDARGPMIWDNFSIFRTNCAILTSYIRANPRTCRGCSRGCYHVAGSNVENC